MARITRQIRRVALQTLYEMDSTGHDPHVVLSRLAEEETLSQDALSLALELVDGVSRNLQKIDSKIQEHAPDFPIAQLAIVDKCLLRIAIWEVLFDNKTPPKVAINEAVELAKKFGASSSYRFVNGVMGSIMASRQSSESALPNTSKGER